MISKTTIGIAVGIFGTIFIGYCIYFDRKRRSDPSFKQKLREKRKKKHGGGGGGMRLPDMKDHEAVQRFFLQEVQEGELRLASGDLESGVEHLSNAVAVCGQPQQILQVLQTTLPPAVFQLVLQRLPVLQQRLMASSGGDAGGSSGMVEDDVE